MDSLFGVRLLLFFFQNLSRPISMQQLLKVTDLLFQLAASFGIYHSLNMKMHKAIAIIQFKLEGQVIKRRPEFNMDKRLLLDKIDYEEGTIMIEGKKYELLDKSFPTIDPNNPYELSEAEEALMNRLCMNFLNCDKLQEHIRFLFNKGGLYLCYNSNLLYHGFMHLHIERYFS